MQRVQVLEVSEMISKELADFDNLPKELRTILNYSTECVDPRYIHGMYKTQGLTNTINYLKDIGLAKDWMVAPIHG